jgi:hypothetical protein
MWSKLETFTKGCYEHVQKSQQDKFFKQGLFGADSHGTMYLSIGESGYLCRLMIWARLDTDIICWCQVRLG